jgi:hypothetical protein
MTSKKHAREVGQVSVVASGPGVVRQDFIYGQCTVLRVRSVTRLSHESGLRLYLCEMVSQDFSLYGQSGRQDFALP